MLVATRIARMRRQRICQTYIYGISSSCIGHEKLTITLLEFELTECQVWARCFHTPYVVLHLYRYVGIDDVALIVDWSQFG